MKPHFDIDKGFLTIKFFEALTKFLNFIILFEIKSFIVNRSYYRNLWNNAFYKPKMNMTGIPLSLITRPSLPRLYLHFEYNLKEIEIWLPTYSDYESQFFYYHGFQCFTIFSNDVPQPKDVP